jgi:hypothetical protein
VKREDEGREKSVEQCKRVMTWRVRICDSRVVMSEERRRKRREEKKRSEQVTRWEVEE